MIVCYIVLNSRLGGRSSLKHLIKQRSKGVGMEIDSISYFAYVKCMSRLWNFGWPKDTFSF